MIYPQADTFSDHFNGKCEIGKGRMNNNFGAFISVSFFIFSKDKVHKPRLSLMETATGVNYTGSTL